LEIEGACHGGFVGCRRGSAWASIYVRYIHDDQSIDIVGCIHIDRREQPQREQQQFAKRRVRGADRHSASGLRPQL